MPVRAIETTAPSSVSGPAWWTFSTVISAIGGLSFNEICGAIAAIISISGGYYAWKSNRARVKYEAEEHALKIALLKKQIGEAQ